MHGKPGTQDQLGIALGFFESYHVCSFWLFELQYRRLPVILLSCRHIYMHCHDTAWVYFVTEINYHLYCEDSYNM